MTWARSGVSSSEMFDTQNPAPTSSWRDERWFLTLFKKILVLYFPWKKHYHFNSPGVALGLGLVPQGVTRARLVLFSSGTFSRSVVQKKQQW